MKIDWAKLDRHILEFLGTCFVITVVFCAIFGFGWLAVFLGKAFFTIIGVL